MAFFKRYTLFRRSEKSSPDTVPNGPFFPTIPGSRGIRGWGKDRRTLLEAVFVLVACAITSGTIVALLAMSGRS